MFWPPLAFARRFRAAGAPVVLVHFALADDYADALRQPVDQPTPLPAGGLPAGWSDLGGGLAEASDIGITKRQWGAFYGCRDPFWRENIEICGIMAQTHQALG